MTLPTYIFFIQLDMDCQELLDACGLDYIQSEVDRTKNEVCIVLDKEEYAELISDLDFNNCSAQKICSYLLNPELGEYATKVTVEEPSGDIVFLKSIKK